MSHLGRIFAVGWVLVGLVIISVTMGALTTALTTIASVSGTRIYGSKVKVASFIRCLLYNAVASRWIKMISLRI